MQIRLSHCWPQLDSAVESAGYDESFGEHLSIYLVRALFLGE